MSEQTGPLERIYDDEISPLMAQIIAVCKREHLPMFATFRLDIDLCCTSVVTDTTDSYPEADREHHAKWRRAVNAAQAELMPQPQFVAYTITRSADAPR
jgi:hypothetical protein